MDFKTLILLSPKKVKAPYLGNKALIFLSMHSADSCSQNISVSCLSIFSAFLLGLAIDMFSDSGGVHAAACVFVAYFRPLMMRSVFGVSYDYHNIKIEKTYFGQRINYLIILILTHHFVLFSLEIFSFAHILLILKKTLFSAIFTLIMCLIFISLFSRKST